VNRLLQAIAWVVFLLAIGSIGFGVWLWFGVGSDDIASIVGAICIGGGLMVAFPSFGVARKGRFRGL
jgi:hypothetical protein